MCKILADAQGEYFSQKKQYAEKFMSSEGEQNGLYWKVPEGEIERPIGLLIAYATGEGYGGQHDTPQPLMAISTGY